MHADRVVLRVGDRVLLGRREFDSMVADFRDWTWEGVVEGPRELSPGRTPFTQVRILRAWCDGEDRGGGGTLHLDASALKQASGTSMRILETGGGPEVSPPSEGESAGMKSARFGLQTERLKELVRRIETTCEAAARLDSNPPVEQVRSMQVQLAGGFLSIGQLAISTPLRIPIHKARNWLGLARSERPQIDNVVYSVEEVQRELAKSADPIAGAVTRLLDAWRQAEEAEGAALHTVADPAAH